MAPMVEFVGDCLWRESGVGGRFCVGTFCRNVTSIAVKMFPHLIYFINRFYTFNVICKDKLQYSSVAQSV
jgi:hypothetical protein